MGTNTRISCLVLLTLLLVGIVKVESSEEKAQVRLPVLRPEHKTDESISSSGKDLLSTLQELHQSLIAQIAVLENRLKTSLEPDEQSETTHLVQHYTAQKNNIEREISLIQSIEAPATSDAAARHILKAVSPEEKSVPALLNIFKKNRNPSNDQFNGDIPYSPPYPPYPPYYVPGYGPQYSYSYPYHGQPPKPDYPYPNDLIQSTFSGYDPQYNHHHNHHHHPQTFAREQSSQNYRLSSSTSPPTIEVPSEYTPTPRVMLQSEIQPPKLDQQQAQYQPPPPKVQPTYTPQRLQSEEEPDVDILKNQDQGQYGQKQGVFIYYPNGDVTENNESERPSIVDRFGQAFDRFGQVISNLANRQISRNGNDANIRTDTSPKRTRVKNSRPRSSSQTPSSTITKSSSNERVKERKLDDKKPKLRWVSV